MNAAATTSRHLSLLTAPSTSDERLHVARQNLTTFVHERAEAASLHLGFGWRATELSPPTFDDLQFEHKASQSSGLPLRVSSRFCSETIYRDAAGNHALRFWHDTLHFALGLSFEPDDEMELGCYHLAALRSVGFDASTIEHRMLHADTIGQTLCVAALGRFPRDQLAFATTALANGVNVAIEMEAANGTLASCPPPWISPDGAAA